MILEQFDDRLRQIKELPPNTIDENIVKKWKLDALNEFLCSLDDADKLSAHVSQKFNYAELLGIKALMFSHDIPKLLKLAHMNKWEHGEKWDEQCPVCRAKKSIEHFRKTESMIEQT